MFFLLFGCDIGFYVQSSHVSRRIGADSLPKASEIDVEKMSENQRRVKNENTFRRRQIDDSS